MSHAPGRRRFLRSMITMGAVGVPTREAVGQAHVNKYLQSWDVPNLFVIGASAFPQNGGYNPTGTVGALTYLAADAIRTRYLKRPGALVT